LSDLEVDNLSALNIDHVEDVRRFRSSTVPTAIDPDDSLLPHLLPPLCGDLPGECTIPSAIKM
jgi:hypothetical protein